MRLREVGLQLGFRTDPSLSRLYLASTDSKNAIALSPCTAGQQWRKAVTEKMRQQPARRQGLPDSRRHPPLFQSIFFRTASR